MKIEETDRYKNLLAAIEAERQAEEAYYLNLSANRTIPEKIEAGILWYPLLIERQSFTVGEHVEILFERTKHLNIPHKLKSGMGCLIIKNDSKAKITNIKGVISYVRKNKLAVIINEGIMSKSEILEMKGQLGVELIFDERPYKVMKSAINNVISADEPHIKDLREAVRKKQSLPLVLKGVDTWVPDHLNASQADAYLGSIQAEQMSIIHGPPGTGKTTTLIPIIKAILKTEKRVLVCASSNNAVDLLAKHLDMSGVSTIRVGNVTRIADDLTHLTLAEMVRTDGEWQHIKKVRIEAQEARKQAGKYKRRFGERQRAERTNMYKEARELNKWAKELEYKLTNRLLSEAKVICSTLIGVSHSSLSNLKFKTVVVDEAAQALEPECWNAILKAERVILAGDHLQLAPTVKSKEAIKLGLENTLLSRMTDCITHSYLLQTQYRMNDKILSFSNKRFYEGKLNSGPSIGTRTLEGDNSPLVMVDTSGCGFDENYNPKTMSRYNEGEYFILREHFLQTKEFYSTASIGIISPYSEQVKFLRSKIEEDKCFSGIDIKVNSIDGFQGQERDVIYISLVRSNTGGEIGFLKDEKRLNVAMTRARKKLIIIGDLSTLSQYELFDSLAQHIEDNGRYRSAWEFMGE